MSEITKEEFGVALYDAIACCEGVQQLLRMISIEVHRNRDVHELSAQYVREKERAKQLAVVEEISIEAGARLVRKYPWLLV